MNSLLLLLFLIIIVVALYFLFGKRTKARPKKVESALYQKLLRKSLGDHALAERLIEMERRQHPAVSRARLLRFAIERWERDNR